MPVLDIGTLHSIRRRLNYEPGTRVTATRSNKGSIVAGNSQCVESHSFAFTSEDMELGSGDVTITFVGPPNGGAGTYVFHDVPYSVYVEFSQAASLGTYYNDYIKDQYSSERI